MNRPTPRIKPSPASPNEADTKQCGFSFDHYSFILRQLMKNGYEFVFFTDHPTADRYIYLRHDVDRSMDKALAMAKWESELGVKSTYFLRLHSRYYNCYSFPGLKAIREIIEAGHEIGLHTEFYDLAKVLGDDGKQVFAKEKRILEEIIDRPVKVFSPHRTTGSSNTEEIVRHLADLAASNDMLCTFDERFQNEVKYISDSSGIWREGCPCGYLDRYPRIQMLVHPIWWFREHIELEDPMV